MFSLEDERYRIRLAVLGYQYDDLSLHFYDLQWLRLRAEVESDRFSFVCEDPSVTTIELERYIRWLEAWATGAGDREEMYPFWDQTLRYCAAREDDGNLSLTVVLAHELLDEDQVPADCIDDHELRLTFSRLAPSVFEHLAEQARETLRRYPVRGEHGEPDPEAEKPRG